MDEKRFRWRKRCARRRRGLRERGALGDVVVRVLSLLLERNGREDKEEDERR